MLSDKKVVCPLNLLEKASTKKGIRAAIVNAGKHFIRYQPKQYKDEY